jgi:hypothetical protein
MKLFFIGILFMIVVRVSAQMDFDVLVCKNASYTNASIIRVTPAYVVVDYSGGIAEVALTNLPVKLQSQFPYDPASAARFIADENKKTAARAESTAKQAASRIDPTSPIGITQTITVESVTDQQLPSGVICTIVIDDNETVVLLAGLPPSVRQYVEQRAQLINQMNLLRNTPIRASDANPNGSDPASTNQFDTENALYVAKEARSEKILALGKQLDVMEAKPQKAVTRAYPTGQTYNGMMIWKCGESTNK